MITTQELAFLEKCDARTIQRNAKKGKYVYKEVLNDKNKNVFMFPISELDKNIQEKYFMMKIEEHNSKFDDKMFTLKEREEINFWIDIVKEWKIERNKTDLSYGEFDTYFVNMLKIKYPDKTFSTRILYKKWSFYINGELEKLMDNRGKHNKGRTKVTAEMRGAYISYFMDEAQHSQIKCYEYMKMYIRDEHPEQFDMIPSYKTLHRDMINHLPLKLQVLAREGRKAYEDICSYHIRRTYENLMSNDYWIGDTHTLDIMSQDEKGKVHRLYLNAWMDVRSGVMVGWHITANPNSNATIFALRDGILRRNSIPRNVYVDNGREYLTHDVGGLGHRTRKKHKDEFQVQPIFARLGITMTNALVKNARAKTIERRFLDFKNHVSRLFGTFTGGSVAEKPEILKTRLKNGQIVIDDVLKAQINEIIEYYFNYSTYNGEVEEDNGKRKIDVYNEHLNRVRMASKDELELMLLRSARAQKVGQRGLRLKINGEKLDYFSEELHVLWGHQVYFRYDPNDLSEIRVYDLEDRYLMTVPCANETVLEYGASQEDIKNAMKITRKIMKNDIQAVQAIKTMGLPTARELVLKEALRNKGNPAKPANPRTIELQRAIETKATQTIKVANGGEYEVDLDTMVENASKRRGGK